VPGASHPSNKDEVIRAAREARAAIRERILALSPDDCARPFLGMWSVKDLVAHLIGWDETNVRAVRSLLRGKLPTFYAQHDRDWQTYNARLVRRSGGRPIGTLMRMERQSHGKLLEVLEAVPPDKFGADVGVRFRGFKVTIERLIAAEAEDERTHARQIIQAFGTPRRRTRATVSGKTRATRRLP
jgi:hypothetical protein